MATRRAGIVVCFFLLALANCGGGGGGGGDDSGGLVAVSTPGCSSGDPCYAGSVTMQPGASSGSAFEVQVVLNKLNTVITAAGLLVTFDPTKVQYQGYTKGSVLGTGGVDFLVTPTSGQIDVSIAVPAGKSLSSAGVMITLAFKALKAGQANLNFLDTDVVDGSALYGPPNGTVIVLGAGAWSGGLLDAS